MYLIFSLSIFIKHALFYTHFNSWVVITCQFCCYFCIYRILNYEVLTSLPSFSKQNLKEKKTFFPFEFLCERHKLSPQIFFSRCNILPIDAKKVKGSTYLAGDVTPYELYIKLLIEYFGDRISYDFNNVLEMPNGIKKMEYQIEAVDEGFKKMLKYDHFLII